MGWGIPMPWQPLWISRRWTCDRLCSKKHICYSGSGNRSALILNTKEPEEILRALNSFFFNFKIVDFFVFAIVGKKVIYKCDQQKHSVYDGHNGYGGISNIGDHDHQY